MAARSRSKVYATTVDSAEHVALVKGDVQSGGPVLARVHATDTLDDILGAGGHRETLVHKAMDIIGREGRGVIVLHPREQARCSLVATQERRKSEQTGQQRLIEYGIGAQILLDLGVHKMVLKQFSGPQDRGAGRLRAEGRRPPEL